MLASNSFTVGETPLSASQFPIIYCNGIEADEAKAREQANIISSAFGGRNITVVHNPTKVLDYYDKAPVSEIVNQLVQEIKKTLQVSRTVLVFAHSHGSHITEEALKYLDESERASLRIYTFAGVTIIPKNLAAIVESYVFKQDWIARHGNKHYGPKDVLENFIRISERAKGGGLQEALIQELAEREMQRLDPMIPSTNRGDYFQLFWTPEGTSEYKEKMQAITAPFTKYNIQLLEKQDPPIAKPEDASIDDLTKVASEHLQGLLLGIDRKYHTLPNFEEVIQSVASATLIEEAESMKKVS